MANKTKTLPPVRVEEKLYQAVTQVAVTQDLSLGEIIRLALLDYCLPKQDLFVPIVGELSPNMDWSTIPLPKKELHFDTQGDDLKEAIDTLRRYLGQVAA